MVIYQFTFHCVLLLVLVQLHYYLLSSCHINLQEDTELHFYSLCCPCPCVYHRRCAPPKSLLSLLFLCMCHGLRPNWSNPVNIFCSSFFWTCPKCHYLFFWKHGWSSNCPLSWPQIIFKKDAQGDHWGHFIWPPCPVFRPSTFSPPPVGPQSVSPGWLFHI